MKQIEERITCSIGIGPNKLIAKMASKYRKPVFQRSNILSCMILFISRVLRRLIMQEV
ncbi:MAG: hypothetical protein SVY15_06670 [Halobacteriota archaeon]|nr:hypothetical protein [Halobacteriota archaeon]